MNVSKKMSETYQSPVAEIMELISAEVLCLSTPGQVEDYDFLDEEKW